MPTLTRFHLSTSDTKQADVASAETLLSIPGAAALYVEGRIGFYPDNGLLYMTVGDAVTLYPGLSFPVWSKNSCGLSVIEFQEAAEAFASLYIP